MSLQTLAEPSIKINRRLVEVLLAANRVSRTEIARDAGVHIWTVTRVLRNRRHVSSEKRQAVLDALKRKLRCTVEELCLGRLAA